MSLRTRILLLVLLATVMPAFVVGAYLLKNRDHQFEKARHSLGSLARYAVKGLDDKVKGSVQLLHGLSRAPDLDTEDKRACSDFMASVLAHYPQYTGLLTIKPNGDLHCDSLRTGRALNVTTREYFQQVRATLRPAYEVVFGGLTGIAVLQVAYPALDAQGQLKYVLLASLNLSEFARAFVAGSQYPDMSLLVWNGSGTLMVNEPDAGAVKFAGKVLASSPLFAFSRAGESGATAEIAAPGGRSGVWALGIPAQAKGMRVNLGVPRDVLLAEADKGFHEAIVILMGVSFLAFLGAMLVAELSIRRQAARIMRVAARVGAGDLAARIGAPYPRGELGELMSVMDRTTGAVEAQRNELEAKGRDLQRANRMLQVLSNVNSLIIRVRERETLFSEACRIAVEDGKFQLVWIGVVDRQTDRVSPVTWRGEQDAYIASMPLGLDAADTENFGLAGRAVLERKAMVANDIASDPRIARRQAASKHGFRSLVVLPLRAGDQVVAVMTLYSSEKGLFDDAEMRLLLELADDISFALENIERSEKLDYLAYKDPLTGLPNRVLFSDRLGQAMAQSSRTKRPLAVIFFDLDRFKLVNDSLGHARGDTLLKLAAERLTAVLRAGDTLGRLGGDEFAAILTNLSSADDAGIVAEKLLAALSPAFDIEGHEVFVSASMGIALHPADAMAPGDLMKAADVAMYRAKYQGGNNFQYYKPEMNQRSLERLSLESRLRHALEREEFVLHYQPRVALKSGQIVGLEALLRWQATPDSLVPPGEFITVLEETGLIVPVGQWVLRRVAQQQRLWRAQELSLVPVAVNLSARQFLQKGLVEQVIGELHEEGIPASLLELELTESLLVRNEAHAERLLNELSGLGVRLSIDDFGTGYSSLAYLKRFPLDALKIDKSFVRDIGSDPNDAAITLAIIHMAHSLGLHVVAEGVETAQQRDFLSRKGCDEAQGYLFHRPLPAGEIAALLAHERVPA